MGERPAPPAQPIQAQGRRRFLLQPALQGAPDPTAQALAPEQVVAPAMERATEVARVQEAVLGPEVDQVQAMVPVVVQAREYHQRRQVILDQEVDPRQHRDLPLRLRVAEDRELVLLLHRVDPVRDQLQLREAALLAAEAVEQAQVQPLDQHKSENHKTGELAGFILLCG